MLRCKLSRLASRAKGCAKSVEMLMNLLALAHKLKLNAIHH